MDFYKVIYRKRMTRTSALTQAVSRAECTPEQKHQRVIDWLNEVHKVLYKNLDLSKHSIKVSRLRQCCI